MRSLNIEIASKELIRRPSGAELAPARRVGVRQVPAKVRDVLVHVRATGLARGRVEGGELHR